MQTSKKPLIKATLKYSFQALPLIMEQGVLGMVVLKLDDQRYGLPLESVIEIIRMVAITPIPESGNNIEGIINLRGEIIPVIDLRKCLKLTAKPYTLNTHIIIAQAGKRTVGLAVDYVSSVTDIHNSSIRPSNQVTASSKYVFGVAKTEEGLLLALDIEAIFKGMAGNLPEIVYSQPNYCEPKPVHELVSG